MVFLCGMGMYGHIKYPAPSNLNTIITYFIITIINYNVIKINLWEKINY